ncbi:MAG: tRNA (guanosine(46)-N7)-methyltransferase TrmB, partial [Candidatus Fonsibacter sp.]
MGEATAEIAQRFADTGFVAIEMHKPGLGALLMEIQRRELKNLKLIQEDAQVVLQDFIPENSIDAIHLFFPDPWPKLRHRKRRIVQSDFVELLASKLKPNAYVQIA